MHLSTLSFARLRRLAPLVLAATLLALALPVGGAEAAGAIRLSSVTGMTTARAAADRERLWADHCMGYERTTVPARCTYGVRTSRTIVALVGDSHASQLFPAVEQLAKEHGWRLEVFVKVSCPFIDMRVRNLALGREYTECATWNRNVIRRIAALKPAMTLVAMSRFAIHPASSANNTVARKGAAIGREIARLYGRVTLIVDAPYAGRYEPACLAAHRSDIRPCSIRKTTALSGSLGAIERIAAAATGDGLIDLTSAFCSSWPCRAVRNRAIVFRDASHLTATFARTLAPALDAKLAPLMP
jgi:hypothetical protein